MNYKYVHQGMSSTEDTFAIVTFCEKDRCPRDRDSDTINAMRVCAEPEDCKSRIF